MFAPPQAGRKLHLNFYEGDIEPEAIEKVLAASGQEKPMIPQNPREDYCQKGNELFQKKDYQGAIQYYEKVLEIDPKYAQAWNNKGVAFEALRISRGEN